MTTATALGRFSTIIVSVEDLDRAIGFYQDVLGLPISVDVPFGDGFRWIELTMPGSPTTLALGKPPEGTGGGTMTGISFTTPDLEALHAELKGKGVDVDAEIARMGDPVPPMFWFRDSEQNVLLAVEG